MEGVRFFCFSLAIGEEIRILVAVLLSGINVCKRAGREIRNASYKLSRVFPWGLFRFEEKVWIFGFCLAFWGGIPTSRVENEV